MSDMCCDSPSKRVPVQTMTLKSDKIKGLEDLAVNDEIEVKLKLKVLQPLGHGHVYDKEDLKRPMEGQYEVISGKAISIQSKIDDAETLSDLDKAVK